MMLGITGYMLYNARKYRFGSHWEKYGPTYLCAIASLMVMADLMRHVLQDANVWPSPGSDEYRADCNTETMACLSVVGWTITILCTYVGFALLFFATMWNAKICEKLKAFREKWRELRAQQAADDS